MNNTNRTPDEERINELSDKSSQILLFLSFALVVVATLKDKDCSTHQFALRAAMRWWSAALFPVVVGLLPLKEFRARSDRWYRAVRLAKTVLLWIAIITILIGAAYFVEAVPGEFPG